MFQISWPWIYYLIFVRFADWNNWTLVVPTCKKMFVAGAHHLPIYVLLKDVPKLKVHQINIKPNCKHEHSSSSY